MAPAGTREGAPSRRRPGAGRLLRRSGPAGSERKAQLIVRQCAPRREHRIETNFKRIFTKLRDHRAAACGRLRSFVAGRMTNPDQPQTVPGSLLAQIVDQLPIALTVQDADGRFILANAAAAASLAVPAEELIGASPGDFLTPAEAADRRQWELALMRSGKASRPGSPGTRGGAFSIERCCSRARSTSPSASRSRTPSCGASTSTT